MVSKMVDLSQRPPGDQLPEQDIPRGIAIPSKRRSLTSKITPPCGCLCGGCSCPSCLGCASLMILDSNRETYGGQGTSVNDFLSTRMSAPNASSFEAPQPRPTVVAPPSLEILSKLNEHTPCQIAKTRTEQFVEDMEDAPWRYFLSDPSMTSDATDMSGLIFGPIDLEGSMENNPEPSGSQSMLSYKSALSVRSAAASAIIQHAGEALTASRSITTSGNPFLELL